MRSQIHKLVLVYPPISNQEAEWVKNDEEVQKVLSQSHLYMIAQRHEGFFIFDEDEIYKNLKYAKITGIFVSNDRNSEFQIDLKAIFSYHQDLDITDYRVEMGDKIFKLFDNKNDDLLLWFTTEKLLFDRSHDSEIITGLDDYRHFLTYKLHYIGISEDNDSLARLIIKPHDKRVRILTNEFPERTLSRLSDELILFFFKIDTLEISTYDINNPEDFIDNMDKITGSQIERICDAEKAFIQVLNAKYNEIKYKGYPEKTQSLFKYNIDRFSFFIGESIHFITDDNFIRGNYTERDFDHEEKADFVFVDSEKVEVLRNNSYDDYVNITFNFKKN